MPIDEGSDLAINPDALPVQLCEPVPPQPIERPTDASRGASETERLSEVRERDPHAPTLAHEGRHASHEQDRSRAQLLSAAEFEIWPVDTQALFPHAQRWVRHQLKGEFGSFSHPAPAN